MVPAGIMEIGLPASLQTTDNSRRAANRPATLKIQRATRHVISFDTRPRRLLHCGLGHRRGRESVTSFQCNKYRDMAHEKALASLRRLKKSKGARYMVGLRDLPPRFDCPPRPTEASS
jgi:hypothetical protein